MATRVTGARRRRVYRPWTVRGCTSTIQQQLDPRRSNVPPGDEAYTLAASINRFDFLERDWTLTSMLRAGSSAPRDGCGHDDWGGRSSRPRDGRDAELGRRGHTSC
jgi:hypothetical protein